MIGTGLMGTGLMGTGLASTVRADTVLPAVLAGLTMMLTVRLALPPRRRLAGRLRPYAGLARSRLGTGYADVSVVGLVAADDRPALVRLLEPSVRSLAERLGRLVDAVDDDELARRLRQADVGSTDVAQYRIRQLGWTVAGLALGAMVGMSVFGSVGGTFFLMAAFGFPAATRQRSRLERQIDARRARMRSEVYTVAQLVAVHLRTGRGPVESIRLVCALGRGPVVEELREALGWMSGGLSPQAAYQRLAEVTPEPAAARLYRLLGSSASNGGDIAAALLAVGDDLRAERRDELSRSAVKRRTAMLVPLLLLIAPVMLLFVGAALPSMVLGGLQ